MAVHLKSRKDLWRNLEKKEYEIRRFVKARLLAPHLGLSLEGFKSMMEMQFADFVTVGFNQIINNLAKIHYRWGQNADVVIRMPTGGGVGAGPFHSQSNEAWFVHTPGIKSCLSFHANGCKRFIDRCDQ